MGQPVALKDDLAQCPLHKGTFAITECHPTWTMHGRGVVVDGCRAACGCEIKSTLPVAELRNARVVVIQTTARPGFHCASRHDCFPLCDSRRNGPRDPGSHLA
ncbi:PAAR domain-containing protein [Enterobacter hormaechei]